MKVLEITTRSVKTKFGMKPVYAIQTSEGPFELGFQKPTFKEGDDVEFTFSEDKYGKKVDLPSLRVINSCVGPEFKEPKVNTSKNSYQPYSKPFPIPPLHGDRAIIRQNSLGHAAKVVIEGSFCDEITNAEEAANMVVKLARIFEEYSCGDSERRAAEGEAE